MRPGDTCAPKLPPAQQAAVDGFFNHGANPVLNKVNANAIGAMLVQENLRSIQYRYPDTISDPSRTPGPLARYWEYPYVFPQDTKALSTLQAFNAISCLDYQSCEHPEWGTSDAHKFLDSLTWALIHALPGYNGADWES